MKKVLISTIETSDEGYRLINQRYDNFYEVSEVFFWQECDDDVTIEDYVWSPVENKIKVKKPISNFVILRNNNYLLTSQCYLDIDNTAITLKFVSTSLNRPATYSWSINGNTEGIESSLTKIINNAGTYTITLTVSNSSGVSTLTKQLVVENELIYTIGKLD